MRMKCETRDEGRSLGYDAEERDEAVAAFCRNPEGRGLFRGSLGHRGATAGVATFAVALRREEHYR